MTLLNTEKKKTKKKSFIGSAQGVNFINVLREAFAPVDPKSVKRYWQLDWILMLLGATGVNAVRKYVGEIEPWCQLMSSRPHRKKMQLYRSHKAHSSCQKATLFKAQVMLMTRKQQTSKSSQK
jgi:hypothetical protein